jgi:hypothetical protein
MANLYLRHFRRNTNLHAREMSPLDLAEADALHDKISEVLRRRQRLFLSLDELFRSVEWVLDSLGRSDKWDRRRVRRALDTLALAGRLQLVGFNGHILIRITTASETSEGHSSTLEAE